MHTMYVEYRVCSYGMQGHLQDLHSNLLYATEPYAALKIVRGETYHSNLCLSGCQDAKHQGRQLTTKVYCNQPNTTCTEKCTERCKTTCTACCTAFTAHNMLCIVLQHVQRTNALLVHSVCSAPPENHSSQCF